MWWTNLLICSQLTRRIGKGSSSNRKRADDIFNEECPVQIDSPKEKMHSPSVACRWSARRLSTRSWQSEVPLSVCLLHSLFLVKIWWMCSIDTLTQSEQKDNCRLVELLFPIPIWKSIVFGRQLSPNRPTNSSKAILTAPSKPTAHSEGRTHKWSLREFPHQTRDSSRDRWSGQAFYT